MKEQWSNINKKVRRSMRITEDRSRVERTELPLTTADLNSNSSHRGLVSNIKLTVLTAFVALLVFFLIWNFSFLLAEFFSKLPYRGGSIQLSHSRDKRASVDLEEPLLSIKEKSRETLLNDSIPIASIASRAVFSTVARRLEVTVGENNELIIWYHVNRNKPDFRDSNDKLKFHTAKLLYDLNIREFIVDVANVLDLIVDDSYVEDFRLLLTSDENGKGLPKTHMQNYIIDRLLMKRYMLKMIDDDIDEMWVIDVMLTTVIDSFNQIDLRKRGVDPQIFNAEDDSLFNQEESIIDNRTLLIENVTEE